MKQLLKLLGIYRDDGELSPAARRLPRTEVDLAIEKAISGIEPRMRSVPGYKKQLRNVIANALAHINELVDTIPGPLAVSNKTFVTDPHVNAFFATPAEVQQVFSNSPELRHFFDSMEGMNQEQAFALLCMNKEEKTVFGMELHDDVLQREVMQTAVNFSEHKILSPAATEQEVRTGIKQCIFDGLITYALQHIVELKQERQDLETQRCILSSRLRNRQSQGSGLTRLLSSATEEPPACEIEQKLADTRHKLEHMPASRDAPRYYLDMVKELLAQPDNFVQMTVKTFALNKMGIVAHGDSSQPVNTIRIDELLIANVLKRVVAIVCYPRNEMQAPRELNLV